ncbi:GNAT family N-acetyltransferase [Hymenobacter chitinivorans]|uniref:RimJ/RimL family protein N-acetyltransferase n=1 Tax=Hymenobacter chitinivorans DSM 11115 TaxID=1121954 RepID=A0A2M9BRU4_9BACT|nr:GNAT family N-acetyltransferase [Hymenobacter chitinivorans]PJJ60651.1 RimJ/RimL family protein N-acetyltransferase [Hymenobacter chitinivorans DSM 11115]
MKPPLSLLATPAAVVPLLETPDLLLRGPRLSDLPDAAAMHTDPDFYRFLGNKPQSQEDVWRRLLGQLGHWAMLGYGSWAIEEKATGRYIGTVGFFDFQRDLTPSISGTPEAGWVLSPRVHGRGYASQALQAALGWAEANLAAARITCIIDPGNAASLRLAGKFGFREFARTTYHDEPIVLLERQR